MDHCEEIPTEFFEARCEASHVLHGAEEALDDVAHSVETGIVRDRLSGVAFVGNDRQGPTIGNELTDGPRAISLVGDDGERCCGALEKLGHDRAIMDLAAGDDKAPGTAMFIDYSVNLTCAAAA